MRKLFIAVAAVVFLVAAHSGGYDVGDTIDGKIAEFKLKNVTGEMVALSDFKNSKGLIVIFDCNTCPYSKAYNERIIALNKKYASKGFPVVAIMPNDPAQSPGDSFDNMVKKAEKKKYEFPYLIDETQKVTRAFGATNTPHVFVLKNNGGNYTLAYIGAIDDNSRDESGVTKRYVEDAVEALLDSREVPSVKTKAIGCTIKFKSA